MITNEKQYKSTRALVVRICESLRVLDDATQGNTHPALLAIQKSALTNQLSQMKEDVALYDELRSGKVIVFEAAALDELPDILIKARIARGMSQKDLADLLGLKEQQIQRYESDRYRSASLDRLIEIAGALNVKISETGVLI